MASNHIGRFLGSWVVALLLVASVTHAAPLSITLDWNAAGTVVHQPADTSLYTLTVTVDANSGQMTLYDGASVTMQLQDFHWSMSNDAIGAANAPIDRDLTLDGITQTVDQEFRFSSYYWSLIGMNLKSGALYESPVMTYDFGPRGIVDVQFLYDPLFDPPSIGTGGTAGSGLMSQNNGVIARFSAHDIIIPEPLSLTILTLTGLLLTVRRR